MGHDITRVQALSRVARNSPQEIHNVCGNIDNLFPYVYVGSRLQAPKRKPQTDADVEVRDDTHEVGFRSNIGTIHTSTVSRL